MATKVEDTLEPSSTSGSGLYGVDSASVKSDKASESLIHDTNKEILRLSVKGFDFGWSRDSGFEDIVILRAGQRKVAIRLLDVKASLSDRRSGLLLVIDLDHVLFCPKYLYTHELDNRCNLQEREYARSYLLSFKTKQDIFKFQEVFTGFSVQTHISDIDVLLNNMFFQTAIQLWRSVPNQYESLSRTTDGPHNKSHAWNTGERGTPREHGSLSTKIDTTAASNLGLNPADGSAMETPASSCLVFGSKGIFPGPLLRIPLDEKISIKKPCRCGSTEWCKHITLVEDNANTRSQQTPSFLATPANVSSITAWNAIASSVTGPNARASRRFEIMDITMQELELFQLEFKHMEDKLNFEAAFDALKRQHEPVLREEKRHSNNQSPMKKGSLTREYNSAAVDAENVIPPVAQKSANTEILPHSPRALVNLDNHIREIRENRRKRLSKVWEGERQGSIIPLLEARSRQQSLLHGSTMEGYIKSKEGSRITSILAAQSQLAENSPSKHLGFPAPAAESLRNSEKSNTTDPDALGVLSYDLSFDSPESVSTNTVIRDVDPNLRLSDKPPGPMCLRCPFYFLDCYEGFDICSEQDWVRHSLTHFHKARRLGGYAGALSRVEPPKSCRCYFCKTEFRRPSGTDCWKDYMHHIRLHCEAGYRLILPDITLIEHLSMEGVISVELYRRFKTIPYPPVPTLETNNETNTAQVSSSPPVPTLETNNETNTAQVSSSPPVPTLETNTETNTAQVSSSIESESSASSTLETFSSEKQGSTSEQVDRKFQPASIETFAKQEQRRRRICLSIIVFMLWKKEQDVSLPDELWSSPVSFKFINVLEISRSDKIKGLFETYSGRDWDWWPFNPPAKPLESGKVRIRWQCACGDQRWTDASRYLARKCQALVNENTIAGHERGNATSQSASSVASHSQIGSVVPGSFPNDTSQSTGNSANICSTAQASHIQNTYNNSNAKDLYVLFCIYQKSQILHSQILASKCQNDEAFFENLRQEYRRLRGFFRFWFSPLQFSHCDFVKFTRFYVNELAKVGHSLPIDLLYQYNPRPPGPHEDPPISPHEFRRRFYTHLTNPCGRGEALERIPKRQKRFQINLHVDGREDMWGLHVELQPSFLVVLIWQIAITLGGWAFMGWWLSRHHGDLQNAAVPVTIIVTAFMALWAPIGKGMRGAL